MKEKEEKKRFECWKVTLFLTFVVDIVVKEVKGGVLKFHLSLHNPNLTLNTYQSQPSSESLVVFGNEGPDRD